MAHNQQVAISQFTLSMSRYTQPPPCQSNMHMKGHREMRMSAAQKPSNSQSTLHSSPGQVERSKTEPNTLGSSTYSDWRQDMPSSVNKTANLHHYQRPATSQLLYHLRQPPQQLSRPSYFSASQKRISIHTYILGTDEDQLILQKEHSIKTVGETSIIYIYIYIYIYIGLNPPN